MKKLLPLLIGLLAIAIVLLLPLKSKLLEVITILFAIPFITYHMRDKDAGDLPYRGCLIGAVMGCFSGVIFINFIMNLLYKDMAKYSIRLDLLLGALLGASIFSSLGIIAGGKISKRKKEGKE